MKLTTALGGAVALGSAVYGAIQSSKYNKQARNLIGQQRQDNDAWWAAKKNEDYLDRTDAQNIITKQQSLLDEHYRQAEKANVVSGGTDEALAMQKAAANNATAQTMASIAANASEAKDSAERQYRAEDAALNQQEIQTYMNQANATAQAASQGVNAGVNLMGIGLQQGNNIEKQKA